MTNKETQKIETQKEIQNYIKNGSILVSLEEYKNIFKKYGLKVDLKKDNYLLKYYNTSNNQHYLCATTSFLDKDNIIWANINSNWYKKHIILGQRQTSLYKNFKEDREKYFTVLKSGHILSI